MTKIFFVKISFRQNLWEKSRNTLNAFNRIKYSIAANKTGHPRSTAMLDVYFQFTLAFEAIVNV